MRIKFCGIRRLEDVAAVNFCQPDYMGMILSGGSPEHFSGAGTTLGAGKIGCNCSGWGIRK